MNKPLIILKNISKKFEKNNIKVLKDINFTFKKGKTYSIIGPSGSGKSTFLNILSLIDRPTSGSLFFESSKIDFNNIVKNDHLRASKIGIIYQENNLLSDFKYILATSRCYVQNFEHFGTCQFVKSSFKLFFQARNWHLKKKIFD